MGIKNAEFHAIWNPLKSFEKMHTKKLLANMTEICTFFTFTHVRQTCFAYNFLCAFFKNFFNRFEISMKFCVFGYLF
jgi:hypothetical protein